MSKVRILSPRPEINKNTAVDAVFLFVLVELWIQTTKFFCLVQIFPSVWCEMRSPAGICDNLPAFGTCQSYLLSPRPRKFLKF